jgi:hypothetical protein
MAGSAPNYDNVMWPGSGGLRVPQEAASSGNKASLSVNKLVTVNGGGASTYTLKDFECQASYLVITNMGTQTSVVSLPAAFPGTFYFFKNSTGSGSNCTFKVTGQSGASVADGSHAIFVCSATDLEKWTATF